MGDAFFEYDAGRYLTTAAGTNAGVSATIAAVTGKKLDCLGIQCSGDLAALVTIESPASTVLWQKRFAAAFTLSERFDPGTVVGGSGSALLVKISASTSHCEANIEGMAQSV